MYKDREKMYLKRRIILFLSMAVLFFCYPSPTRVLAEETGTAIVASFEELRLAVANPEVTQIEVITNLTRSGTGTASAIGSLNRNLTINGNGFQINFGADNGSLNLSDLPDNETAKLRITNAQLSKSGTAPIVNSSSGAGWTLELEDVTERSTNASRLVTIPEGRLVFTGGVNTFNRPTLADTFIRVKDLEARNGAEVTITRGNAYVLFSAVDVSNPSIKITEQASIAISTVTGYATPITLRGKEPTIEVTQGGKLTVTSPSGSDYTPTDVYNNTMTLPGESPKIEISEGAEVSLESILNRRGIHMPADNAEVIVSNAKLSVATKTSPALNVVGNNASVSLNNAELSLNTTTGPGISLNGNNPEVSLENSTLSATTTTGYGLILNGEDALLALNDMSKLNVTNTTASTTENIRLGNGKARPVLKVTNDSQVSVLASSTTAAPTTTSNNAISLYGLEPQVVLHDSSLTTTINAGVRRGLVLAGSGAEIESVKSIVDIEHLVGAGVTVNGDNSKVVIKDESKWGLISPARGTNLQIVGKKPHLSVSNASQFDAKTEESIGVKLQGDEPGVSITGVKTLLNITNNYMTQGVTSGNGALYLGDGMDDPTSPANSSNAYLRIADSAKVSLTANLSSALEMQSTGGTFDLSNKAELVLASGATNGDAASANGNARATLRFVRNGPEEVSGNYNFNIDNATMSINKSGGTAPGIRMYGSNNHINVKNNGKFTVQNKGNGTANNGNTGGGNQGIHYVYGNDNSFIVENPGSEVRIDADYGPGIDMGTRSGAVNAIDGGYFKVSGRTASTTVGVFAAGNLSVDFDKPLFMDFRNNRPGGGAIFSVANGSTLKAVQSDLAVWKKGSDLDGDPDLNYRTFDYGFSGKDFATLGATDPAGTINLNDFGNLGLSSYSRLNSNNARWAIVDELHLPTNADNKVYGHVSIPVGLYDSRSAWDDETTVTVQVTHKDGSSDEYTGKTVGHSNESPGISIYGENPRAGLFEIELDGLLQKGDTVKIVKAVLTSGELTPGFNNLILTDEQDVFPIVPTLAEFQSTWIPDNLTSIQGHSANPDVEVIATHNGNPIDTTGIEVDAAGNFTLPLSDLNLKIADEIQVFLQDNEGSAVNAKIINPPITNNNQGNISPVKPLDFHDTTFLAATKLTVAADVTLTVEFINELGTVLPGYTIVHNGKLGETIDLSENQRIIDQLANLGSAGYEITKHPDNETELLLDELEMTVQYQVKGIFGLTSVPDQLNFGTVKYDTKTIRVDDPDYDERLIVTDMRAANPDGWTLLAKLETAMSNDEGQELTDALRYVNAGKETILNGGVQPVYQKKDVNGTYDVSDSWGTSEGSNGVKLVIDPTISQIQKGSYTGVISWQLMEGTP